MGDPFGVDGRSVVVSREKGGYCKSNMEPQHHDDIQDLAARVSLISVLLGELLDGMADGRWGKIAPGTRDRFSASAHAFADGMALLQPSVRRAESAPHLRVVEGR